MCEQTHVKQMLKNVDLIKQAGIKIAEYRVDDGILVSSYIQKPILEDVIMEALKENNADEIYRLIDRCIGKYCSLPNRFHGKTIYYIH